MLNMGEKPFVVVSTLQVEEMTLGKDVLPIMGGIQTRNAMEGVRHQARDN